MRHVYALFQVAKLANVCNIYKIKALFILGALLQNKCNFADKSRAVSCNVFVKACLRQRSDTFTLY